MLMMKLSICLLVLTGSVAARAAETPPTAKAPVQSMVHESLLPQFSPANAAAYLDKGVHAVEKRCFACHGTYAYLQVASAISPQSPAYRQTRRALEESIEKPATSADPKAADKRPTEAVMAAAALAQDDSAAGKLHPLTRKALDRMWELQQPDGGWKWLKQNEPPSALDDHFGATMAAIAAGAAPENYASSESAKEGLNKLRAYLRDHPPQSLHQRAMLMLAAARVEGLMTAEERKQTIKDLFALQHTDGGWTMAGLGDWKRLDGQAQDLASSDGYGTGFVVYVLRHGAGVAADDPRIRSAVGWMKTHQRTGGGWYTRSPRKADEIASYAGSVYVVLALSACGEITPMQ